MATLILDNSKQDSELLKQNKQLFEKLGIEIIRFSPYNPYDAGKLERFFRATRGHNNKNNALFIHN